MARLEPILTPSKFAEYHGVPGIAFTYTDGDQDPVFQCYGFGQRNEDSPITNRTRWQMASLSKTLGAAFGIQYLRKVGYDINTPVNEILRDLNGKFCLELHPSGQSDWQTQVTVKHLLNHTALGMHYVYGAPLGKGPSALARLEEAREHVLVAKKPGQCFSYSGAGFILLQYILELHSGRDIEELMTPFLVACDMKDCAFSPKGGASYATGYRDDGTSIAGGRLQYAPLAAGAECTPDSYLSFLSHLSKAYDDLDGSGGIQHETAVEMLYPDRDLGSEAFMGTRMGLGVFIARAQDNLVAVHQGANDGFRAFSAFCFSGPDRGKGIVINSNGETEAVSLIAEVARRFFEPFQGVSYGVMKFSTVGVPQEQIVNKGYKELVFGGFVPPLATLPKKAGRKDPNAFLNGAIGAEVLYCSDESFARASNLFSPLQPTFDPDEYGPEGKVMDSWESGRHSSKKIEIVEFRTQKPLQPHVVRICTMWHSGNHCQAFRLLGKDCHANWVTIIDTKSLEGHAEHWYKADIHTKFDTYRLEGIPDGGLSRISLFEAFERIESSELVNMLEKGQIVSVIPYNVPIPQPSSSKSVSEKHWSQKTLPVGQRVQVSSCEYGARIQSTSCEHYGSAENILLPSEPSGMHDGFETKRSREKQYEEVVIDLGAECLIDALEMDFTYFVNNNPVNIQVWPNSTEQSPPLVALAYVKPYRGNRIRWRVSPIEAAKLIVRVYPDGGFNRLRAYGSFLSK